jgi:hypothetical protein
MRLYLHYTREVYPGDDATFGAIATYAVGHFERNHSNMRTTDRLGTRGLSGVALLDQLRDADGNPARLEATGIDSDADEALLAETRAQGWRVAAAY